MLGRFSQEWPRLDRWEIEVDAINAVSKGLGVPLGPRRPGVAQSGGGRTEDRNDTAAQGVVAISDRTAVSPRGLVRQDRTTEAEEARGQRRGEDENTRAGTGDPASSQERARLRELYLQDMQVRSDGSGVAAGDAPLRGSPMFEVEVGPFGRAYATDSGVVYDPPQAPDERPMSIDTGRLPPVDAPGRVLDEEAPLLDAGPVERSRAEDALREIQQISAMPAPPGETESSPVSAEPDAEVAPQRASPRAEQKTAEAYRQAANLAQTPGGTNVSQSLDAFG